MNAGAVFMDLTPSNLFSQNTENKAPKSNDSETPKQEVKSEDPLKNNLDSLDSKETSEDKRKLSEADMKQLLLTVFKVAKVMAPTVIFIDDLENLFSKEKKKKETRNSKETEEIGSPIPNFRKNLQRQIKSLKPGEEYL